MADRIRRRNRRRQRRLVIPRPVLNEEYNDVDFFARYRFRQQTVHTIVNLSRGSLEFETNRNRPLSAFLQVCIALRYLAGAGIQQICGDCHDVATSTICRSVWRVVDFLTSPRIINTFLKIPRDTAAIKQGFYSIAKFPNVVGLVDGTQIPILKPAHETHEYMNRKGYASINVQMICDHRFIIYDCVAKWPGSAHDSRVFRNSQICRYFENGRIDGILLGDSGYPTKRYLMTPYCNPVQNYEQKYNAAHTRTRVLVEQTFGILKRRFGLLKDKLRITPDRACKVTVACVILHNLGINVGDIIPFHDEYVFQEADHVDPVLLNEQGDGLQVRDYIARTHFN